MSTQCACVNHWKEELSAHASTTGSRNSVRMREPLEVPKLRPIDSTRIPSAVKSRKCDAFRDIYTNVKECTSLDTRYHGDGLMELQRLHTESSHSEFPRNSP
ncbi:hypothetical protein NDU88_008313 [Pleurodeles waltl]|uniref:Uncharacterized protein n=1 Tax=Pleurodeles waltl TaxID=8319 RepID=A0AAV7U5R5_PLEWA|nr:hypothetical protein NDU88_008313 [Pleurodeles waltl]